MKTPVVSVMLPFHNPGRFFAPAIRSILNQTYSRFELLLCDDGSTDGSLELAKSITDPRVVVWSDGKSRKLAARLNECIGRARGSLLARMDADDISYPNRLARQVEFMNGHPEIDLLGCKMLICGENNRGLGKRPLPVAHGEIVANPSLGFGMAHPTWMGRAEWYRRYQYDPGANRFEDVELLYRAHPSSRFANLPDILLGYRELRGGFRKRLRTRRERVRYLHSRRGELGSRLFLRAMIAETVKAALDAGLAATSTRYLMMRVREQKLTEHEHAEWRAVLAGLDRECPGQRVAP